MKTPQIRMFKGGRFASQHEGALVYYDSQHRVLKVPCEGAILALVQERNSKGYRNQLLTVRRSDGNTEVLVYE